MLTRIRGDDSEEFKRSVNEILPYLLARNRKTIFINSLIILNDSIIRTYKLQRFL